MIRIQPLASTHLIEAVMRKLPPKMQRRLQGVDFILGVDPLYIGLHDFETVGFEDDVRSLRDTTHCCWKSQQSRLPLYMRETTIVVAKDLRYYDSEPLLLHELGHALNDRLLGTDLPPIVPMDKYMSRNYEEAFATAFQAWATPGTDDPVFHCRNELLGTNRAAVAFFDLLAA